MLACGNENLAANFFSKCLSRVFLSVKKVKISKNIRDKHGEKDWPIKFSLKQANIQNIGP